MSAQLNVARQKKALIVFAAFAATVFCFSLAGCTLDEMNTTPTGSAKTTKPNSTISTEPSNTNTVGRVKYHEVAKGSLVGPVYTYNEEDTKAAAGATSYYYFYAVDKLSGQAIPEDTVKDIMVELLAQTNPQVDKYGQYGIFLWEDDMVAKANIPKTPEDLRKLFYADEPDAEKVIGMFEGSSSGDTKATHNSFIYYGSPNGGWSENMWYYDNGKWYQKTYNN